LCVREREREHHHGCRANGYCQGALSLRNKRKVYLLVYAKQEGD